MINPHFSIPYRTSLRIAHTLKDNRIAQALATSGYILTPGTLHNGATVATLIIRRCSDEQ